MLARQVGSGASGLRVGSSGCGSALGGIGTRVRGGGILLRGRCGRSLDLSIRLHACLALADGCVSEALRLHGGLDGVLFLASPMSSAITGVNLPVDAGWLVGASWASYGGLRD